MTSWVCPWAAQELRRRFEITLWLELRWNLESSSVHQESQKNEACRYEKTHTHKTTTKKTKQKTIQVIQYVLAKRGIKKRSKKARMGPHSATFFSTGKLEKIATETKVVNPFGTTIATIHCQCWEMNVRVLCNWKKKGWPKSYEIFLRQVQSDLLIAPDWLI